MSKIEKLQCQNTTLLLSILLYNAVNWEYNVAKSVTLILSNLFAVLSTVTKMLPYVIGSVKLSVVLLLHLMYHLLFPFHPAAYCSLELACECVANGAL